MGSLGKEIKQQESNYINYYVDDRTITVYEVGNKPTNENEVKDARSG